MADQIFNVNCGFFDSMNRDRLYSADQMNKPYKRLVSNGVFATPAGTPSTDLQVVSANNAMNIICKKGEGIFADKWYENTADIVITVPANTNITPRRDSVIIQVDKRQNGRTGNIVYREGTPSSNPQVPAIGTVDNVIEYRLANIYVAPGANYIGNDAIVDLRGSSECPWVTHLLKQVDTSTLFTQWQTAYQRYYDETTQEFNEYMATEEEAFNAFMQSLTEELTVNTNVVKYESHYTTNVEVQKIIPINITSFNKARDVLMVRINGLFATENVDYTISNDGTNITLTKDLRANQNVDFIVLQSVVVGDTPTVLQQLQVLNTAITSLNTDVTALKADSDWINFILESGTAFDNTVKPAIRKVGNQVYIRGAIKGLDTVNVPICTLPTNMRPSMNHQYTAMAISNNGIAASCVLEVRTTGSIYLIAKSGTIPATAMLSIATQFVLG